MGEQQPRNKQEAFWMQLLGGCNQLAGLAGSLKNGVEQGQVQGCITDMAFASLHPKLVNLYETTLEIVREVNGYSENAQKDADSGIIVNKPVPLRARKH